MRPCVEIIVAQKDKQEVPVAQQKVLALVGRLEEDMVVGFPFQVPPPYDTAPLLKGRATVEMEIKIKVGEGTCFSHPPVLITHLPMPWHRRQRDHRPSVLFPVYVPS